MTRKDYIKLAEALKEAKAAIRGKEPNPRDLLDGVDYAVDYLIDALRRDNPRFNADKFRDAVGL